MREDKYENMSREELIRELRLLALRRQVTPHFLFNSLSVAMSLVMQSPKVAVKFLRHLAQMYRYLLRYGNDYSVPIRQEIEMMQQYYELMSLRHVDSLRLTISPEARKLKDNPLPPLALQGLMENAIKHNTHTPQQPLEVKLYISSDFLIMENSIAPLLVQVDSTKMGLAYMNETMQLLFGKEILIENDGETFKVKIPLINL